VNTSFFRVTQFSSGFSFPNSMQQLSDGSIAVVGSSAGFNSGAITRLVDANHDGVADGPGTVLYQAANGPLTGFVKIGSLYAVGNLGDHTITLLTPGVTPADPMTPVGSFSFAYPGNWEHNNVGMAVRPTPGTPGSYDLVFNVGSEYDHQLSTDKVPLSGLFNATLDGDALYLITINENGSVPTASGFEKVATGIRNAVGMQFDASGNFYFADNAIDGPGPDGDEPPQADELNFISSSDFGSLIDFGYPTCYVAYRTGVQVGGPCQGPLVAFQPLPNGTPLGSESEGPSSIAFSPVLFPGAYNDGIFIGFAGKYAIGPPNEENAIVYYDFGTGQYIHFVENSLPDFGQADGLLATSDSLFVSDLLTGNIYEISAAPEPRTVLLFVVSVTAGAFLKPRLDKGRHKA
jgi:hypothetical protein